jgi:hypothetical protein
MAGGVATRLTNGVSSKRSESTHEAERGRAKARSRASVEAEFASAWPLH